MMILTFLLIGFVIYYLLHDKNDSKAPNGIKAEDMLRQRYVNGEIDDEAYTKMMKTLKG